MSEKDKLRYEDELKQYKQRFSDHGLPVMESKREKQKNLYHYITLDDAPKLANFIVLMNVIFLLIDMI